MPDDVKRTPEELLERLRVDLEWAQGNEWEAPICLSDDLEEAIRTIEQSQAQITAAMADMRYIINVCTALGYSPCGICAHINECGKSHTDKCPDDNYSDFEWRDAKETLQCQPC
ncbi:MAG: hypothetical protein Q4Q53_08150, partial [Methanocorpusculum sp.]|nr:hypothetical protein [Methanocorpusculum sp.]